MNKIMCLVQMQQRINVSCRARLA